MRKYTKNISFISQLEPFIPYRAQYSLTELRDSEDGIEILFESRRKHISCPCCSGRCDHTHSSIRRTVGDLPFCGKRTSLTFVGHKYYCHNPLCPRKIITEEIPGIRPYGRRTRRLERGIDALCTFLSFSTSSLVLRELGIHCSPSTCGRLFSSAPSPPGLPPPMWG